MRATQSGAFTKYVYGKFFSLIEDKQEKISYYFFTIKPN